MANLKALEDLIKGAAARLPKYTTRSLARVRAPIERIPAWGRELQSLEQPAARNIKPVQLAAPREWLDAAGVDQDHPVYGQVMDAAERGLRARGGATAANLADLRALTHNTRFAGEAHAQPKTDNISSVLANVFQFAEEGNPQRLNARAMEDFDVAEYRSINPKSGYDREQVAILDQVKARDTVDGVIGVPDAPVSESHGAAAELRTTEDTSGITDKDWAGIKKLELDGTIPEGWTSLDHVQADRGFYVTNNKKSNPRVWFVSNAPNPATKKRDVVLVDKKLAAGRLSKDVSMADAQKYMLRPGAENEDTIQRIIDGTQTYAVFDEDDFIGGIIPEPGETITLWDELGNRQVEKPAVRVTRLGEGGSSSVEDLQDASIAAGGPPAMLGDRLRSIKKPMYMIHFSDEALPKREGSAMVIPGHQQHPLSALLGKNAADDLKPSEGLDAGTGTMTPRVEPEPRGFIQRTDIGVQTPVLRLPDGRLAEVKNVATRTRPGLEVTESTVQRKNNPRPDTVRNYDERPATDNTHLQPGQQELYIQPQAAAPTRTPGFDAFLVKRGYQGLLGRWLEAISPMHPSKGLTKADDQAIKQLWHEYQTYAAPTQKITVTRALSQGQRVTLEKSGYQIFDDAPELPGYPGARLLALHPDGRAVFTQPWQSKDGYTGKLIEYKFNDQDAVQQWLNRSFEDAAPPPRTPLAGPMSGFRRYQQRELEALSSQVEDLPPGPQRDQVLARIQQLQKERVLTATSPERPLAESLPPSSMIEIEDLKTEIRQGLDELERVPDSDAQSSIREHVIATYQRLIELDPTAARQFATNTTELNGVRNWMPGRMPPEGLHIPGTVPPRDVIDEGLGRFNARMAGVRERAGTDWLNANQQTVLDNILQGRPNGRMWVAPRIVADEGRPGMSLFETPQSYVGAAEEAIERNPEKFGEPDQGPLLRTPTGQRTNPTLPAHGQREGWIERTMALPHGADFMQPAAAPELPPLPKTFAEFVAAKGYKELATKLSTVGPVARNRNAYSVAEQQQLLGIWKEYEQLIDHANGAQNAALTAAQKADHVMSAKGIMDISRGTFKDGIPPPPGPSPYVRDAYGRRVRDPKTGALLPSVLLAAGTAGAGAKLLADGQAQTTDEQASGEQLLDLNKLQLATAGPGPGMDQALGKAARFLGRQGMRVFGEGERAALTAASPLEDRWAAVKESLNAPTVTDRGGFFQTLKEKYYNQLEPTGKYAKEALARGVQIPDELNPLIMGPNMLGGGMAISDVWMQHAAEPMRAINNAGLRSQLDELLTLNSIERLYSTGDEHLRRLNDEMGHRMARGQAISDLLGDWTKLSEAKKKGTLGVGGINASEAGTLKQRLLASLPAEHQKLLNDAAVSIDQANKAGLAALLKEGLIDKQDYATYMQRGLLYTPVHQLHGEIENGVLWKPRRVLAATNKLVRRGGRLSVRSEEVINQIEGSDQIRYAESPTLASMGYLRDIAAEIARNRFAKAMVLQKEWSPEAAQFIKPYTGKERLADGLGTVSYFVDGKAQTYTLPIEMADALEFAHTSDIGTGLKSMTMGRKLIQSLATSLNLAFLPRNLPRDFMDAFMLTDGLTADMLPEFATQWGRNVLSILREEMTPVRERFKTAGGDYASITKNIAPEEFFGAPSRTPFGLTRRMLNATEQATKETVFDLLTRKGGKFEGRDLAAAAEVRKYSGSPDFGQRGYASSKAAEFILFFNPQVQGAGRMLGRYRSQPERLVWHMGGITAGLLALHRYNSQFTNPDTGRPAIEDIPEAERQQNIIIMQPDQHTAQSGQQKYTYYRIPLGHAARVLWTPIQDAIRAWGQGDAGADPSVRLDETVMDTVGAMLPGQLKYDPNHPIKSTLTSFVGGLNPLIKLPVEQLSDMNSFTQSPIVGRRLEALPLEEQFNEKTSSTMKALGAITGGSPVRLEHAYRSLFPGPGEMALSLADTVVGDPGEHGPMTPAERTSRSAFWGPFSRPWLGTPSSQVRQDASAQLYDRAAELAAKMASLAQATPEEKAARMRDPQTRLDIQEYRLLEKKRRQLGEISKMKDRIRSSPNAEEQLQRLWQAEMKILGIVNEADARPQA